MNQNQSWSLEKVSTIIEVSNQVEPDQSFTTDYVFLILVDHYCYSHDGLASILYNHHDNYQLLIFN